MTFWDSYETTRIQWKVSGRIFGGSHLKVVKPLLKLKMALSNLGGGFKYLLFSSRKIGEMIQFDEHIFQKLVESTN